MLLLAGWLAGKALAQQYSSLSGIVRDTSDAVVPGAIVLAVQEETGFRRQTVSQDNGGYVIGSLEPGVYRLTARKDGFRTVVRFGVKLDVGQATRIDFALDVGSVTDSVTVEGNPTVVRTLDGSVGTHVGREWIEKLPLNGRGLLTLLELAPATVATPATRGEAGQFTANGQRPNSHYFTVDGLSVNSGVMGGGQPTQSTGGTLPGMTAFGSYHSLLPMEALSEFRVQTSTLVAEYGRQPGAQVALSSRSGSNEFHGSLFHYLRNEKLDANDWFANRYGLPRAPQRMNDFGATLGGPLRRNRTFFFGAWEQLRLRQPLVWRSPVPSAPVRASVPGFAVPVIALFPAPNGPALGPDIAEWIGRSDRPSRADVASLRLDHALSPRVSVFGRYNQSPSWNEFGDAQINRLSLRSRMAAGGLTGVVTPTVMWEFRAGYSFSTLRSAWRQALAGPANPCPLAEASALFQQGVPCSALYRYSIGGLGQIVSGRESPIHQSQWNTVASLTIARSSHQVRLGADFRRIGPDRAEDTLVFSVMADSLADFLARRDIWVSSTTLPATSSILREISAFAQDQWRAADRLTLTYGLRWELTPAPVSERLVSGLNNSGSPFLKPGALPIWSLSLKNVAPRAGAALRLSRDGQSVLRGGFGLFYDSSLGVAADLVNGGRSTLWQFGNPSPDVSGSGRVLLDFGFRPDLRLPLIWQWNVSVERAIHNTSLLSVAYVGSRGRSLLRREVGGQPSANLVRTVVATNNGSSDYHGLQVQFRKRMSRSWQAAAAYSWSHALDTGSTDAALFWVGAPEVPARADRASADFDVRHALSTAASYEWKGWAVDGIFRARSGFPLDILASERAMGVAFANVFRPDVFPGAQVWIADRNAPNGRRLNRAAFFARTLEQGGLGRNALAGFGSSQLDASLRRQFRLGDRLRLDVRMEVFNLLNRANLADPVRFLSSPLFGEPASMLNVMLGSGTPASGLAPLLQSGGARSMQALVRLRF